MKTKNVFDLHRMDEEKLEFKAENAFSFQSQDGHACHGFQKPWFRKTTGLYPIHTVRPVHTNRLSATYVGTIVMLLSRCMSYERLVLAFVP